MRSLKKFIAESVHTYDYTIKVAGGVDKNFLELFKYNLDKFSPVDIKVQYQHQFKKIHMDFQI